MIPVVQTKFVIKNSTGDMIIRGNCYAACIASILEVPITEVPNVEVFFNMKGDYWIEVMITFLRNIKYDLCTDDRFKVFHDTEFGAKDGKRSEYFHYCRNKYYLISGKSPRDVHHICIFKNGEMVHDPHPTKEGLVTFDTFQTLEKETDGY